MKWVVMLVISLRGINFGFWSHLGCSGQNAIIFSRKGLVWGCTRKKNIKIYIFDMYIFNGFYLLHSYNPSFLICLCFNMVSFRGKKKLGPQPDRSPLGVSFKISDEHPHLFHMWSPPPPPNLQRLRKQPTFHDATSGFSPI